jgi:hypothetical protein
MRDVTRTLRAILVLFHRRRLHVAIGRLCRDDVPDEDPEPLLAAYCPSCTVREFDSAREDDV